MGDRELLELAAKAAGYTSLGYGEMVGGSPCLFLREADFTGMWSPLTDDGDALRLAVKLRIIVNWGTNHDVVRTDVQGSIHVPRYTEVIDGDILAATRRAITRAAAAIEKGVNNG